MKNNNTKISNFYSGIITSLLVVFFTILIVPSTWAQRTQVIDNKGTIKTTGNTVITAATAPTSPTPIQGDIWYDTSLTSGAYTKIWDGTAWKIIDTYLGYKTIHHDVTGALAITNTSHNLTDLHVESTGDLTIDKANVSDGTSLYITNTTATDRSLTFTNFSGAYLRNGGVIADISGTGLTVKANTRYLLHITDNAGSFYFNATEAGGSGDVVPLWKSDTNGGSYSTDDIINYNGTLYRNRTGTNTDTTPDSDTTNWVTKEATIQDWISNTDGGSYPTNDLVSYEGIIYKNVTGTNLDVIPTADIANWLQITEQNFDSAIPIWTSLTNGGSYQADQVVVFGGRIYRNTTGTNTDTNPSADTTNWTLLSQSITTDITNAPFTWTTRSTVDSSVYSGGTRDGLASPGVPFSNSFTLNNDTTVTRIGFLVRVEGSDRIIEGFELRDGTTVLSDIGDFTVLQTQVGETVGQHYFRYFDLPTPVALTGGHTYNINVTDLNGVGGGVLGATAGTATDFLSILTSRRLVLDVLGTDAVTINDAVRLYEDGLYRVINGNNVKITNLDAWTSNTNGGTYTANTLVVHDGVIYRNLTGTNLDTTPDSDATNWKSTGGGDIVPLWKSDTNGGSYSTNDIINYDGVLYKNLTGNNTDVTPNTDTTNWRAVTNTLTDGTTNNNTLRWNGTAWVESDVLQNDATNVTVTGDILASTGSNLGSSTQQFAALFADQIYDEEDDSGTEGQVLSVDAGGNIDWVSEQDGIENWILTNAYNQNDVVINNDKIYQANAAIPANTTFAIGTTGATWKEISQADLLVWVSAGTYSTNDLAIYNGIIYRNLTGTNTTTAPNADFTNWKSTGGGDIVPLWKSDTNGGSYSSNDIVNYSGVLYKNLTGTNLDTLPNADTVNWVKASDATVTAWVNATNGSATYYAINDLVSYNGVIYKNLTGTNLDTLPDADFTNWKSTGGGDIVPLWKSVTNGGSYTANDIVNYAGVLYKNLTGTNLDTTPDSDTTNWKPTIIDENGKITGNDVFIGTPSDTGTGGTVTTDGDWTIHTFTSSGTFTPPYNNLEIEYLVVAGGGAGNKDSTYGNGGGGGGAGGVRTGNLTLIGTTPKTVTIGAGGLGGNSSTNGDNTVFDTITSIGGGHGGSLNGSGASGGSGGGGGWRGGGSSGTPGQGNGGGAGSGASHSSRAGGGGGGASAAGTSAGSSGLGHGGDGISSSISGAATYYGGGGGGASGNTPYTPGTGGLGGGGNGGRADSGNNGTANTGGGGGGAYGGSNSNGAGGSGIVIIRYKSKSILVTKDSKVGVGTDTPTDQLHVEGNARITGALKDSNNEAGTAGQLLSSTATGTDWVDAPGGDIVPLWKSVTNGGSYSTNDIINYDGVLYKNLTGTNLDTTPDIDATNWENLDRYFVQDSTPPATKAGDKWFKPSTGEYHIAEDSSVHTFIKVNAKRFLLADEAKGEGQEPTNGEALTVWKDLTANGNDATLNNVTYDLAEKALSVDAADGVRFDGAIGTGEKNIFLVLQKKTGGDVDGRTIQATTGNYIIGHWGTNGDAIFIEANPNLISTGVNNLAKRVYGLEYLNSSSLIFRGSGNPILADTSANDLNGLVLAMNSFGFYSAESTDTWVQAFVEFDKALTTGEREQVEGYLAHKFGIEADLPAGHTYKAAAPTAAALSWESLAETKGRVKDTSGDLGTDGQILSSTATGTDWVDPPNKVSGRYNAGVAVALGDLQVRVAPSGNNSLQIFNTNAMTVTGGSESLTTSLVTDTQGSRAISASTWTYWDSGLNLTLHGNRQIIRFFDEVTGKGYEVLLIVGFAYNNNFISIQEL
ncbi:hypothetical protein OAD49_02930 [Flavobacteriaceae bacterium]|nr:hypothetical protein [Flavobacteriaceae bacterium]